MIAGPGERKDLVPFVNVGEIGVDNANDRTTEQGYLLLHLVWGTEVVGVEKRDIPAGGIRGAAQLLERELTEPQHREYTQIIIGEADRLRKLVDRMLGPRGQLHPADFNVHEVLEHVRQVVEIEAGRGVTIHRDYDPSLPNLHADRDLLVQAFLNLVRNAVQALGEAGGTITLRTRAQRKFTIGSRLHRLVIRVDVCDDGPGVDPSLADSIFFPMVSGRADGSGLGLPIAQSLVNRQGGLIDFTSAPGNTVFTVWLPIRNSP